MVKWRVGCFWLVIGAHDVGLPQGGAPHVTAELRSVELELLTLVDHSPGMWSLVVSDVCVVLDV